MEVKINREIRDYTESVFFGMSLRQCVFAAGACAAAVGLYFALEPYLGLEELSWVCILGAAPFAALGFIRWHSMSAEQFVWAWVKSELLTPKRLILHPENLYHDALVCSKRRSFVHSAVDCTARLFAKSADQEAVGKVEPEPPARKSLAQHLKALYLKVLARLYEQAAGKRDVHDKDSH